MIFFYFALLIFGIGNQSCAIPVRAVLLTYVSVYVCTMISTNRFVCVAAALPFSKYASFRWNKLFITYAEFLTQRTNRNMHSIAAEIDDTVSHVFVPRRAVDVAHAYNVAALTS